MAGFFYFTAWNKQITDTGEETRKDVSVVASNMKSTISEGSKYIELARISVEKAVADGQVDASSLEKALNQGVDTFSVLNDVRSFGIFFLLDQTGKIIARSDGKPPDGRMFSDRYFFKQIISGAAPKFVVGPMIVARTTGRTVFHVAVPVNAANGALFGVIALQLDVEYITNKITDELVSLKGIVSTVSNGDQVVLRMPLPSKDVYGQNGMQFEPIEDLPPATRVARWFSLNRSVVSQIAVPELWMTVFSDHSKNKIFKQYVRTYYPSAILILLGLAVYSYLMFLLNRNIRNLAEERHSAMTDRLTNLPNRRAFDERYQNLLPEAHRNRQPVSLLFVDIDHFKRCNDQYGHDNGDLVLKKVAELLRHAINRPLDGCFRWGGEEMVCLLEDTDSSGACVVAEKILDVVRTTAIPLKDFPPAHVTVSIGVATANYSEMPLLIDLVGAADRAMYRAKEAGRDRFEATLVCEKCA